jgi:catechol 2,3-dioxygenase-like lactoylglutathione lyase family enzyme
MESAISRMLTSYEQGKLSRRQLIQGPATLTAVTETARGAESTFKGMALNHIAIRVTNVQRSRDFYQKHFGMPVLHEEKANCFLGLGKNFLTLFENQKPGLDHFCIAIEDFKAEAVMDQLNRQGLKPRRPSGTDLIYFPDPDEIEVQVSAVDHHA